MSDQHSTAERIRITLNATLALAAHHGVILDQSGHTVVLPEGEPLRETVARVLYARDAQRALGIWEYEGHAVHDRWQTHADAVIDAAPTETTDGLARLIHGLATPGTWAGVVSSDRAHHLITAQHVARIVQEA
jgi:hypothetical protein